MNSVVHFEMPYDNRERMARFYHTAFGWETQAMGEQMGNYVLATTTETDPDSGPTHPGAINGGFFPMQSDRPAQYPSIVIAVEDMSQARDRVTRAGGRVLGEPMEIPGVGTYVSFMDPEGNRVAMLEPSPRDRKRKQDPEQNRRQRTKHAGEPVSPRGGRMSPATDKNEQDWSPRRPSEQMAGADEDQDDSYGAQGGKKHPLAVTRRKTASKTGPKPARNRPRR
jgi:predicted enzyme related to lactoylglutathione lyase